MPSILRFVTRRRPWIPTGAGERGRHDAQIHSAEARGVGGCDQCVVAVKRVSRTPYCRQLRQPARTSATTEPRTGSLQQSAEISVSEGAFGCSTWAQYGCLKGGGWA